MTHLRLIPIGRCLVLSTGLLLAACGGGGGDEPGTAAAGAEVAPSTDGNTVPVTALGTPEALVSYIAGLPADDAQEPLSVSAVVPPVSDTDEPLAL